MARKRIWMRVEIEGIKTDKELVKTVVDDIVLPIGKLIDEKQITK